MTTLRAGERAPACFGVDTKRMFYSSEDQYGRPAVLILVGAGRVQGLRDLIDEFAMRLAAESADVLLILDDNPSLLWSQPPIRTIDAGDFLRRCGVGACGAVVLVIDRNLRIGLAAAPSETIVADCLACLESLPQEPPQAVSLPAPAIVLPNLLSPAQCRDLIDRFESSPTMDGEVVRVDAAGHVCSVVDHSKKYRRDMPIAADDPVHKTLLSRCAPEILKAFQGRVTHIDRILVSCYAEGAGWFRRHRDNTAANVAFREFALSLNLNTGEYQGGHLLFPEYNDHQLAAPTGGGVIFSSALLHEAAPVTQGRRFVLLTFFHGDAAEARRQAYLANV